MKPRVMVLYYSMTGNTYRLARAVCEGIAAGGGEAILRTVPELVPEEKLEDHPPAREARLEQKEVPAASLDELAQVDGLVIGSPTRFGNMCAQLRNFLDQTGGLWMKGALVDKPAGAFCCTATMHGGQETTLVSMICTLMHHGALIVGVPYSVPELTASRSGGTPYGASAVVGPEADERPLETDLRIAREQGRRVARLAGALRKAAGA